MTQHHYVPVSVLSSFVSEEAWKVVEASRDVRAKIALVDKNTIKYGQVRNRPLVVYDKYEKRFTRRSVGQVCSAARLYSVPDYNDKLTRAMFRYNLQFRETMPPGSFDFETFMHLGDEPLDEDQLERVQIGRVDGEFGGILSLLRNGGSLNDEQTAILLRFVAFGRFRSIVWKKVYFPELYERQFITFKRMVDTLAAGAKKHLNKEWGKSFETLNNAFEEHIYHLAIAQYSAADFNPLTAFVEPRIKVLHTKHSRAFITCDNPARPFHPNRLPLMFDEALPGFSEKNTWVVYPLSPLVCVVVSSDPSWPKIEFNRAKDSIVRMINTALAIMAEKEIVFSGPSQSIFEDWITLDRLRPLRRP